MGKTTMLNNKDVTPTWYHIDVNDVVLGRAATVIATILRGKHRPTFTPHVTAGDVVVVTNAAKVKLTGTKWDTKKYHSHSGHMGHLKEWTAAEQKESDPRMLVIHAVKGMLNQNKARKLLMRRLKVYAGNDHPHTEQKLTTLTP